MLQHMPESTATTSSLVRRLTTAILSVTAAATIGAGVAMSQTSGHTSATATTTTSTVLSSAAEDATLNQPVDPAYESAPAPVTTRSS